MNEEMNEKMKEVILYHLNTVNVCFFLLIASFFILSSPVLAFDEDEYTSLETVDEQAAYLIEHYNEEYARELLLEYADPQLTEVHLTSIQDFSNPDDVEIFLYSLDTEEGIRTLNTNKYLFAQYLAEYDISFETNPEGDFSLYDSKEGTFITEGKYSTSFSVEVLDNMQTIGFNSFDIAADGSLIFQGFNKNKDLTGDVIVGSGEFVSTETGSVILSQGAMYVDQLGGEIELPDNCNSCYVELYDDHISVSGKNILLPSNNILLSGNIDYYSSTHLILSTESSVLTNEKIQYAVSQDTDIFGDEIDHSDNTQSYIQFDPRGELIIDSRESNEILISLPEKKQPLFYSISVFSEKGGTVTLRQGKFTGFFADGEANIVGIPPTRINTEKGALSSASFCATETGEPGCTTSLFQQTDRQKRVATQLIASMNTEGSPLLSQRGYYEEGDVPEKGSVDYQNIAAIQALTGALERGATPGVYDAATKESVLEWQTSMKNKYTASDFPGEAYIQADGTWDKETAAATVNLAFFDDPSASYYEKENFEPLYYSMRTRCIAIKGNCATVAMHTSGMIIALRERGLEPTNENIQTLLDEQQQGQESDYLARAKFYGTADSAWDMSTRIREHGGQSLYWREEDGALTREELKEDPYYPFDTMKEGDVLGFWYDGGYAPLGDDDRHNSHVGVIVGKERQTYTYDASKDVNTYLHETLNIQSDDVLGSVPLYAPNKEGVYQRVYGAGNQQYFVESNVGGGYYFIENGEEIPATIEKGTVLVVDRPILVQQITDLSAQYLDQAVDRNVYMTLYEHMRPAETPNLPSYETETPKVIQTGLAAIDRKIDVQIAHSRAYLIKQGIID